MVVPVISIIIGIAALFAGIMLGSLLGSIGSFEIVAFILRIPVILVRSPKKLKSKWKMWRELMASRKIERLKRKKEIKELEEKIAKHKEGIKNIKAQIRRVKWECSEPEESY